MSFPLSRQSKVYSENMIQRGERGERPTIAHALDGNAKIISNPFNNSLIEFSKTAVSNNIYDIENFIANTPQEHRTVAQKFMDLYLSWLQFSKPEIYNQFKNFDRYGMPRSYASDPRWRLLSHGEKQSTTSTPDSKSIMQTFYDTRQTIGKKIAQDVGLNETVFGEMSGVSKAIWDLIDHTMHPTELSQARIAQAFDPKTYRFKHGGNEKLEELLKKAFDSEEEFKEKVDTFANKPEIPYSPQDLNEPPLEHKPKAQPATPQDAKPQEPANGQQAQPSQPHEPQPASAKPDAGAATHVHCTSSAPIPHVEGDDEDDVVDLDKEMPFGSSFATTGGPKNGTDPHGGDFSTTGGPDNDDDEKINCHDEKKEINQSDRILSEFIRQYKKLPNNYITKAQARNLGWNPKIGNLNTIAPDKIIGGDIFNNAEKLLPDAAGRIWYEADLGYKSGFRGCERIIFSSDGLIYKTVDHYKSFIKID